MRLVIVIVVSIFLIVSKTYAINSYDSSISLENLLNHVKTMQANFTQDVYDAKGKIKESSSGSMAIKRPGKFRWEIKQPIPQLIIANTSRLYIYDPDLQQMTIRAISKTASGTPALLLSHVSPNLDAEFTIKQGPHDNWFELIPKQRDSMFAVIQMGFNNGQIKEMRLQDHLGHITHVKFVQAQINQQLPSTLFTFKPPAQTDVIDETKRR